VKKNYPKRFGSVNKKIAIPRLEDSGKCGTGKCGTIDKPRQMGYFVIENLP
jgi:hypothetical protein